MQVFSGCSNLSTIIVDEGNEYFTSVNNILFSKDLTTLYFYPSKCGSSYNIPDTVTTIASAFSDCENLTSVNIPDTVKRIGAYAFFNCSNLPNIHIPDSVTGIGSSAFKNCTSLKDIDIPDSVTEIGNGAFSNCANLKNVNIPKSITMIDSYVFSGCSSLSIIEIPNSVTWVSGYAFENCMSLKSIVIPESVSFIDLYAFYGCENLTIYGYTDSYVETYANENNIPFVPLDDTESDIPKSGKCGNDVYWEFTDENTLNIYGTGVLSFITLLVLYRLRMCARHS